jgi:signal peptidase II
LIPQIVSVVLLDQISKFLIQSRLSPGESVPLIPSVLHLTLHHNTGAAFGLLEGHAGVLTVVSFVFVLILASLIIKMSRSHPMRLPLGLMMGGAIGNLIDRLLLGHVIDFIDIRVWPIFNVADACLTAGTCLIIYGTLRRT